ncbi:MAG: hypothetical protein KDJ28_01480 [Candidatus Competibacteraceae bacterium]|nr:hypothetical protein [Candidatus Competibacteraceae bacterium]
MTLGLDTLAELAIATLGGLATVGLTVLKLAMRGMEKQHEATQKLIEEQFKWAEQRRIEASEHWEKHFDELKKCDEDVSRRIGNLETRVMTVELHLAQKQPISLSKARDPLSGNH